MQGKSIGATLGLPYLWSFVALSIVWLLVDSQALPTAGLRDVSGNHVIGRDFVNVWLGGSLALKGDMATLFDGAAYNKLLADTFGPGLAKHFWSYPPHALLAAAPFALLPYPAALLLWQLGGLALFVGAVLYGMPRPSRLYLGGLALIAPATMVTILIGQNGLVTGGLFLLAFRLLERRPALAGVLIGLLTIKPHLGVVLALYLLVTGAWRTILFAAATSSVLVGASVALFGLDPWVTFWDTTLPFQARLLDIIEPGETGASMLPSPLATLRVMGLGHTSSTALHIAIALVTLAAVLIAARANRSPALNCALIAAATPLVSPYAFNYDMTWLTAALIWLGATDPRGTTAERLAFGLAFVAPTLMMILHPVRIPIAPLALLGLVTVLIHSAIHSARR